MRRQSRTSCRRIWLYGISLIAKSLVVQLLQQIPQAFNILDVVCDVRILQINPVAHLVGKLSPFVRVHHDILSACVVVFVNADFLADVFLRDSEALLHAQLYWQTVSVPTCLTLYLIALHGLVSQEHILDGTAHDMVNARMSVGRRRTLKEDEWLTTFSFIYALMKDVILLPLCKYPRVRLRKI